MSIDVMTKVIQRAPVAGSKLTCMLVMANWCNDDGDSLYPSIALLAEAMRVSRSQAKRVLRSLMPSGDDAAGDWWFRVVGNDKGGAPGMTRRYEMNVARLDTFPKLPEFEKADERRQKKGETGRTHAPRTTQSTGRTHAPRDTQQTGRTHAPRDTQQTGRTHAPPRGAPMRPDSSEEPSIERERAMDDFDQALKRWPVIDSPKAARKAWDALSLDDRLDAVSEIDRFVAINRSAGRKLICSLTRYLAERMWKALPERPKASPAPATTPRPAAVKQPTKFQRQRPELYPELFAEGERSKS
ncbi:hypothetical protein LRP31_06775 [Mesorhizobium mediterraneum]|uniref:Helix-turn-helix domain-containing protein n=1 Tax=Mesorhizobium mediterraneum TaxID=43617 RepID=A0AB36R4G9_9HYPH|nr:hypothetical protein [Mesorhizobium mediterraneum]PAP99487.1 hypothetical protein CIT25_24120 [Mesorhizobium mediterraneum]WIW54934.1 hypothetical protein LRP31_06775 [Mesorhizobium mediterraneum]